MPNKQQTGTEKEWGFSDFFHNATEKEREAVFLRVAKEANEAQRKLIKQ